MAGKLAAEAKRRGRPRKKQKGWPPGALAPDSSGLQQPPSSPPVPASRRSVRQRRPRRVEDYAHYDDDYEDGYYSDELRAAEEEEEAEDVEGEEVEGDAEWERRGKKFKLLQKLPYLKHQHQNQHQRSPNRGGSAGAAPPYSSSDDGASLKPLRKGKAQARGRENDDDGHGDGGNQQRDGSGGGDREREDDTRHAAPGRNGGASGIIDRQCSVLTTLPDKKMLEKLLDKLQKKDTYGVYAEPVDPEELPDYHEIIEHPMDFATIRKKLSTDKYANLDEFESDVFLVCTNAMEYNAPDTIYFRQARSIQELARKKFQTIRLGREDAVKSEQNVHSSSVSVTEKAVSPLCKTAQDPAEPMFHKSSAAMLVSNGKTCTDLNAVQPSKQPVILEGCIDDIFSENKSEKGNAMQPSEEPVILEGCIDGIFSENKPEKRDDSSAKNSPVKVGKKIITLDENHRATYNAVNELPDDQSDSLFAILENESKHLVAVGLDAEYSYARSLARFAGTLGPIAWRIASEKIEKALPTGVKFGPGWVGEYEPLPTPVLSFESHSQQKSAHDGLFKHNAENWKNKMLEVQRKSTQSVATGTVQLFPRTSSDSSTTGAIDGKVNNVKDLPACSQPLKQPPPLLRSNTRSKPIVSNVPFLPHNSSPVTSSKDQSNPRVGTSVLDKAILHNSSPMTGNVADIPAQRPERCAEILASRLDFVTSDSKNIVQSGPKQSQMVSTSCMDTRGTPRGKDVGTLFGNSRPSPLGFFLSNQMTPGNSYFSHADHTPAINDPVEVMKVTSGRILNKIGSSESLVTDNHKLIIPTVPSPRSNSSAAATAAARAWMSVGRSSEHKMVESPAIFNMEVRGADAGNLTAESHAHASGIHDDGMKGSMPSVSRLPSKVAAEECQTPRKHVTAFPQLILTELSRYHGQASWRDLVPHVQQKQRKDVCPPDLNISFHAPGSPVLQSGILVDSQQPDLALQL